MQERTTTGEIKKRRPKSANGEGGGRIRPDGTWEWRITLGDGRRLSAYGRTRAEAKQRCLAKAKSALAGIDLKESEQTLGHFLDRWLADVVQPQLAPKTYVSYRDTVRLHIVPTLGKTRLGKLTAQQVQALFRAKEAEGKLSPRSIAYIRAVLRSALNRAVKWNLVERNVVTLTDAPRQERFESVPLTQEQAHAFLHAVAGDRLEALYLVTAALGLRLGEGLGLRWQDVDLDTGTLRVRQIVQRVDKKLIIKEPKTAKSRRTLTIPEVVVDALRHHRDRQTFEAGSALWTDHGLVFTTPTGGPLTPDGVLKQFKKSLAAAGLPDQRFHDLRHYAATFMVAKGVPLRVVMDVLGHSKMATTTDLYAHVMPHAHREVANLFDEAMRGKTSGS